MNSLDGKSVVISGAGGGIGAATVRACAEAGAQVLALDLPGTGLDGLAAIDNVVTMEADVTEASSWSTARDTALAEFGRIDGLFNNAGIEGAIAPIVEYPEEMFSRVLDVNVKGVWLGMKTMAPTMGDGGGGAIVNVSSVAGIAGAQNLSAYVASKHAVIGLTKTAALEFAEAGLRVNAICPSPIQTRMMRSLEDAMKSDELDSDAIQEVIAAGIPLGRYGEPEEVAALTVFLLSDDSSYLSGAAIPIDGALKAR